MRSEMTPQMYPFNPEICDWYTLVYTLTHDVAIALKHLIGELVDNSLDAGATLVEIIIDQENDNIVIYDNGQGSKDLMACFKLGESIKEIGLAGRWAVGLKLAGFTLGNQINLESLHNGWFQGAIVDLESKISQASAPERHRGTSFFRVTITGLRKRRFKIKDLSRDLSLIYAPALLSGKRITLNGVAIPTLPQPVLTDTITFERTYEGLSFRAHGGVIADESENERHGYHLVLPGRRVLNVNETDGLGRYSGKQFFAWIELLEDTMRWPVEKNKRGLMNEDIFLDSLYPDFEPAIRLASEQARELRLDDLSYGLNEVMGDLWGEIMPARKKRSRGGTPSPGKGPGTGTPGGTGTASGDAGTKPDCDPEGTEHGRCSMRIYINVEDQSPSTLLGQAKISTRTIKVAFNSNSPAYQMIDQNKRNSDLLADLSALDLIAGELAARQTNMPLPFEDDNLDDVSTMSYPERYRYYASRLRNHYAMKKFEMATATATV